jgi:hypothetical protein
VHRRLGTARFNSGNSYDRGQELMIYHPAPGKRQDDDDDGRDKANQHAVAKVIIASQVRVHTFGDPRPGNLPSCRYVPDPIRVDEDCHTDAVSIGPRQLQAFVIVILRSDLGTPLKATCANE